MFDSQSDSGWEPDRTEDERARAAHAARDERLSSLQDRAVELAAVIAAATGELLEVVADYDEASSGTYLGNRETRDWLAWACGATKRSASRYLTMAHRLRELPRIRETLKSGGITFDKAEAISRIASEDNEEVLLEWARYGTAEQLRTLAAGYLRSVEATEDAFARRAARKVTYHFDDFGDLNLAARLPGEEGAVVVKALEDATEKVRADAAGGPQADMRPAADRADALVAIADTYLAADPTARSNAERYQVLITAERDAQGDVTGATVEKDVPLPAQSALRLMCDCSAIEMTTSEGRPFDIGRKSRRPTAALRRALVKRDGCCRFPGCTRKASLDAHHIEHWIKHGETKLDNLVLVCRRHHRLVHEGGYTVSTASGGITFYRPDGEVVPDRPPRCEMSKAEFDAAAELLYATPAEPHLIDPLDLDLAVSVLHSLKRQRAPG